MDSKSMTWRNSQVLKVSGVTVRPGTYTSQGGKTIPFTRELCKNIFSNSPTLTPSYLTHEDRDTCGYFYKLGYNEADDTIHYEGFVFDPLKQRQIVSDGFNSVSPEIEFDQDASGNFIGGTVTGNAFVRNPAIEGTKVDASFVAFSQPAELSDEDKINVYKCFEAFSQKSKDGNLMVHYAMKSNPDGTYAFVPVNNTTPESFSVEDVNKIKAEYSEKIKTLEKKIETFEAEAVAPVAVPVAPTPMLPVAPVVTPPAPAVAPANDEFKVKYEAMLNEKANSIVSELKGIGLKEPEKIGAGLTGEQRISVLTSVKENVLKTAPVTTPAAPIVTAAPVDNTASKLEEIMKANGIGEQFKKYIKVN